MKTNPILFVGLFLSLFAAESVRAEYQRVPWSEVEVCQGPTRFQEFAPLGGCIVDGLMQGAHLQHAWIRTPYSEVGMGPKKPTMIQTVWTDHTGLGEQPGSRCYYLPGCNLECVERNTRLGDSTGIYSAINTCQHVVNKVLAYCGCYDICVETNRRGRCTRRAWPALK